ncbi:helix-turn-helix transcriptional regulator [Streptomyces sp. NPDC057307]|uniref:helix-turn-helix transcriptional regulator n=1 Tax=Streptomyces sp. NPDC057307 TaxID=3346096 RepID=UPI00363D57A7
MAGRHDGRGPRPLVRRRRPAARPGAPARAAGVSESTLCRIWRRQLGVSPVEGLERLRLARAEPLLWLSNLPRQAIAVQCGFADAYHFSRRFRAVHGVSPSAFRTAPPESAPPSPVANGALSALQALVSPSRSGR